MFFCMSLMASTGLLWSQLGTEPKFKIYFEDFYGAEVSSGEQTEEFRKLLLLKLINIGKLTWQMK